ncbi:MAG: hypothetical protein M0R06_06270 [Sphaerochaeta sp.]|jgi:hypothetical protein|nr:hypothetical protein [Sphaerochaeta sp.]
MPCFCIEGKGYERCGNVDCWQDGYDTAMRELDETNRKIHEEAVRLFHVCRHETQSGKGIALIEEALRNR